MTSTARSSCIVALGGGRGHRQRARAIAEMIGGDVQIIDQRSVEGYSPADLRAELLGHDATTLIVDTFPAGVAGEIDTEVLAHFERTILIRRYIRPGTYAEYDDAIARYGEHWIPYHRHECEWGGIDGRYVGPLTRTLGFDGEADVLLIGDRGLLPWALPPGATTICGPFSTLPKARATISVGAGHNITYELRALGARAGFVPLPRRYDDQYRRADRFGCGLFRRADYERLLAR